MLAESGIVVNRWFTDYWWAYHDLLPAEIHQAGKDQTQSIERKHLDLRTRIKRLARRTICFSNRADFYGLNKGWHIIFVIFLAPAHHRINSMDELVANGVQDQHFILAFGHLASVVVLQLAFHPNSGHSR